MQNGIVILVASLGGPPLVNDILSSLPHDFDLPILVLQQMESDFSEPLTSAWSKTSALNLVRLVDEVTLRAGDVYIIPYQMYPVFESLKTNIIIKPKNLQSGSRIQEQWDCAIKACIRQFEGEIVLILLTNNKIENSGFGDYLQSLRDAGGTIICCRESIDLPGDPADTQAEGSGWLEMEIDQIVNLLKRSSQDKQHKMKRFFQSRGR